MIAQSIAEGKSAEGKRGTDEAMEAVRAARTLRGQNGMVGGPVTVRRPRRTGARGLKGLVVRAQALPNEGGARKPSSMKPVKAAMVDETEVNQSEFSDERIQKTKEQLIAELTKEDAPAGFSGLNGKALVLNKNDFPTMAEVAASIPAHCKVLDTKKSMAYFYMSTGIVLAMGLAANAFVPVKAAFLPFWLAYAAVCGTAAFGFWLMGHECGHFAFSNNLALQDAVGFFSHTMCLTPYFSWQRSHAVHHSKVSRATRGGHLLRDLKNGGLTILFARSSGGLSSPRANR